jgi:hypothetical protein
MGKQDKCYVVMSNTVMNEVLGTFTNKHFAADAARNRGVVVTRQLGDDGPLPPDPWRVIQTTDNLYRYMNTAEEMITTGWSSLADLQRKRTLIIRSCKCVWPGESRDRYFEIKEASTRYSISSFEGDSV